MVIAGLRLDISRVPRPMACSITEAKKGKKTKSASKAGVPAPGMGMRGGSGSLTLASLAPRAPPEQARVGRQRSSVLLCPAATTVETVRSWWTATSS